MSTNTDAARLAKAAAAGTHGDQPPLIVLGDGEDKAKEVFGVVTGTGTIKTKFGESTTILLANVESPVGTPLDGERALACWATVLADRIQTAAGGGWPAKGSKLYAAAGEMKPSKADPSRTWRDYLVTVEPPATDSLGQLVENPEPTRSPDAPGVGNEPPF